MAKVKLGATLADARNAAGGIVYSKNQFGAYVRQKVSPVQPRGVYQQLARAQTQHLATYWANTLTALQRAAWIALAEANPVIDVFGDSQILTGLQYFVRVNRNRMKAELVQIDDAPADQVVSAPLTLTLTADVSDNKIGIAFTPTPPPAGHHVVMWLTPQLTQGKAFAQSYLKLIQISAAAAPSPIDVTTKWRDRYGTFVAGPKLICEMCFLNGTNGAESAALQASCTISA